MSTPDPTSGNDLVLNASQQLAGYTSIQNIEAGVSALSKQLIPATTSPGETAASTLDSDIVALVTKWKPEFQAVSVADKKVFMQALTVLRQQLAAANPSPNA